MADGQGLNMGCLLFVETAMAWDIAKAWCENEGARLVEIYTRSQHVFLKEKLDGLNSSISWGSFWTGGTDEVTEGRIVWASSGREIKNTASLSVILRSQKGTKLLHTSGACPGDGSHYY